MPIQQTYYLNGPDLASATCVFSDALLTICAPDGFYSDGVISREQVSCVLLPQQTCEDCCVELCSNWTVTPILGSFTIGYINCFTGEYEEVSASVESDFCVQRGTTPTIVSGDCDLVKTQDCGCCSDLCNTYRVTTAAGEYASFYYVDCSGNPNTFTIYDTNVDICVKSNTSVELRTGNGTIQFMYCGC